MKKRNEYIKNKERKELKLKIRNEKRKKLKMNLYK